MDKKFTVNLLLCKHHLSQIAYLCFYEGCKQSKMCQKCHQHNPHIHHREHVIHLSKVKQFLVSLVNQTENFEKNRRNKKLKMNEEIEQYQKIYQLSKKEELNCLERAISKEKKNIQIVTFQEKKERNSRINNYFKKLKVKGLIDYRIQFSNPQGIQCIEERISQFQKIQKEDEEVKLLDSDTLMSALESLMQFSK